MQITTYLKSIFESFKWKLFFSWCTRKPPKTDTEIPVPPLRGDEWHQITVLPYLVDHYYGEEVEQVQYFTEHELNGN